MTFSKRYIFVLGLLLLGLILVACGTGADEAEEPTEAPEEVVVEEPTEEPAPEPTEEEMVEVEPLVIGTTDSWSSFESAWVYNCSTSARMDC